MTLSRRALFACLIGAVPVRSEAAGFHVSGVLEADSSGDPFFYLGAAKQCVIGTTAGSPIEGHLKRLAGREVTLSVQST